MADNRSDINSLVKGTDSVNNTEDQNGVSYEMLILNLSKAENAQLASIERIKTAEKLWEEKIFKSKIDDLKRHGATEKEIVEESNKLRRKKDIDTINLAMKMEDNLYKYSTAKQKAQMMGERADTLKETQLRIKQKMSEIELSNKHGNTKNKELKEQRQLLIKSGQEAISVEERKRRLTIATIQQKRKDGVTSRKEIDEQLDGINESFQLQREQHAENIDNLNEQIALLEKKKEESGAKDGGTIDKEIESLKEQRDDEKKASKQNDKNQLTAGTLANVMKGVTNALNEGLSKLGSVFSGAINTAVETVGQYRSFIEARLQGTDFGYDELSKTLKSTVGLSAYVKQKDILTKLNDAVDKGIAYNVEQRAFLATVTDKIVSTFDAFDSNLMRLIRLQQADTTSARMGLEAELLQFFNSTFSDNSYLQEGYDRVSETLIEANSQMSRDMSVSFEYNVQKWLGSLSSLGFGTDTIQTIAQGINYLGSGNVQGLSSATQLQNLLAMSATKAGYSFSELLVKGIDDNSVNDLLKSMVDYLREIAESDNAVVKAAYGDIFNFTQADLRAIKNLTDSDISNIHKQTLTYSQAVDEAQSQLNSISSRLSTTEMINNVIENFLYSSGEEIANNAGTAFTWKLLNIIEEATGGIHLPAVSVMGNMVDLSTFTIEGIAKTVIFGLGALSSVGDMISALSAGNGLNLDAWDADEYTKRGGDFDSTVGGVQKTVSGSKKMVTSGATSDTKKASVSSLDGDVEESSKTSKEVMKDEITLETLYDKFFKERDYLSVRDTFVLPYMSTIANSVASVNTNATTIVNKLTNSGDNPINVRVTNLSTLEECMANSSSVNKFLNITSIDEITQSLADKIVTSLNGGDSTVHDIDDDSGDYTLKKLIMKVLDGTINVSTDDTTKSYLRNIVTNTQRN